jgi:F-type H+-transporting ATPase subunit delta
MTFHAASREAYAAAEQALLGALKPKTRSKAATTAAAEKARTIGEELFAVVGLLDGQVGLRRALADASAEPERRRSLLAGLLSGKVDDATLAVLTEVVGARWSSPRQLTDGIELLGQTALLAHAEQEGRLDTVEDELFRFGRIVAGSGELEQALADRAAPAESKAALITDLLGDKADDVTVTLVRQLVTVPRGRGLVAGLGDLAEAAATRRERSVATVVSAGPLTEAQQERLAATLQRIYARPIALHVEVDPDLRGGLVIRVGDEVIDGSVTGRLDDLRRRLAG